MELIFCRCCSTFACYSTLSGRIDSPRRIVSHSLKNRSLNRIPVRPWGDQPQPDFLAACALFVGVRGLFIRRRKHCVTVNAPRRDKYLTAYGCTATSTSRRLLNVLPVAIRNSLRMRSITRLDLFARNNGSERSRGSCIDSKYAETRGRDALEHTLTKRSSTVKGRDLYARGWIREGCSTYEQNEKQIADFVCPQNAANRGGLALCARRK